MGKSIRKFTLYPPMMTFSLFFAVYSYLVPVMMKTFSMNYTQVGTITTAQSLGGAVAQVFCFSVFSALNKSRMILICTFGVAIVLMWLGFNKLLFMMYILFFFRGFFGSGGNTISNAMTTDIFVTRKEFYVGLYHSLGALAAVVGPYLALALGNNFTLSLEVVAVIVASTGVIFIIGMKDELSRPMIANRSNFGGFGKVFRLLRMPNMGIALAVALLCSFSQNTIAIYISCFGYELRGVASDGAFALSMYLVGLFLGSLLYSFVAHKVPTIKLLLIGNSAAFGILIAMLFCSDAGAVGVLLLAGGIFVGANIPGLFVELAKIVPGDSGSVSALLFMGSMAASLISPVLVGFLADLFSLRYALMLSTTMFIPAVLLIYRWYKRPVRIENNAPQALQRSSI